MLEGKIGKSHCFIFRITHDHLLLFVFFFFLLVFFRSFGPMQYEAYLDLLLDSMTPPEGEGKSPPSKDHKPLVRSGSLIFCDNILWKGRVMAAAARSSDPPPPGEDKAAKRDRVLAQAMHEFNVKVRKDKRVEQVVLPLRDGLTLIRVL